MGEWPSRALGELVDNFDGRRVPVKETERRPGPYPYYGASGVVDHVDGYLFDGEYLLVAEDGENLRTRKTPVAFLASGRFWVNNHAHILKASSEADTRFLNYALSVTDIGGYITGSTMPKLTQSNLHKIPVVAPPIAEQRRIADILGALDDKIELNHRIAKNLADAVHLSYRSLVADADVGQSTVSVYEIADVVYGAAFSSALFNAVGEGTPLLRIRDLPGEEPGVWTTERHPKGHLIEPGDIAVGMDGEFRAYVWAGEPAWLNQRVCSFTPRPGYSSAFVLESIREPLAEIEATETGTTVIHLGKSDINRFRIPHPPSARLADFDRLATPMLRRAVTARQESHTLAAVRDSLLPRLLSTADMP